MKKTLSTLCLALSVAGQAWSQSLAFPGEGKQAADFVPAGWEIMREAKGDLNGDGLEDLALVIRGTDPKLHKPSDIMFGESRVKMVDGKPTLTAILDQNPRAMIVLVKEESGYRLVGQNQSALPSPGSSTGETLYGFEIKSGVLNFGLVFMHRRHGEVYLKTAYQFRLADAELNLVNAARTQTDRHVGDTDTLTLADFEAKTVTTKISQFSSRKLVSEKTAPLEADAIKFQDLTSNWVLPE